MTSTILIVDDFRAYRSYVRKILQGNPEFRVIGEAGDGLTAVQKASEMQPDVILLDINMPALSGLDAIRLIQKVSPSSRVIFVTAQTKPELIRKAFEYGASAYLDKMCVEDELISALRCVMDNMLFLGTDSLAEELGPVQ
jgi:DNA-binding NarL/FixJ family response regulator